MREFLLANGNAPTIAGSRNIIRQSYKSGYISEGEAWLRMVNSRNEFAHIYRQELALKVEKAVREEYYRLFVELRSFLEAYL